MSITGPPVSIVFALSVFTVYLLTGETTDSLFA